MKYMNMKRRFQAFNLQILAGDGGAGDDGGDAGEDDQEEGSEDDQDDDDPEEKKFSQKDVDETVKKRLARERRKWQREQDKKKSDGGNKAGADGREEESDDVKARKAAEDKASTMEVKLACYEAGVSKDSVDDVAALARSYMASDDDLDLEDAIEKVVKKYPHFKGKDTDDAEDETDSKKSWGQRQNGKAGRKLTGVEKHFYDLNPDLKN